MQNIAFFYSSRISELNDKLEIVCLSLRDFHELQFPPKKNLSNLHFVQKASTSSSSHCAHGNEPKFKFTLYTLQPT